VSYTIQIDNEKINRLEKICNSLGTNVGAVMDNLIEAFLVDPFYLKENQEFLAESIKQLNNGEEYTYNDVDKILHAGRASGSRI
jgi:hypothetical protein